MGLNKNMANQINIERVQDLWNCGCTDKKILDFFDGDFSLKEIKKAREELGLYENLKKEDES